MARKDLSNKTRYQVLHRDNFTCQYCGNRAPSVQLHIDHIVPVSLGGGNDLWNLITACEPCNSGKHDGDYFGVGIKPWHCYATGITKVSDKYFVTVEFNSIDSNVIWDIEEAVKTVGTMAIRDALCWIQNKPLREGVKTTRQVFVDDWIEMSSASQVTEPVNRLCAYDLLYYSMQYGAEYASNNVDRSGAINMESLGAGLLLALSPVVVEVMTIGRAKAKDGGNHG